MVFAFFVASEDLPSLFMQNLYGMPSPRRDNMWQSAMRQSESKVTQVRGFLVQVRAWWLPRTVTHCYYSVSRCFFSTLPFEFS